MEDNEDEEVKEPHGFINDCDFNISPSKIRPGDNEEPVYMPQPAIDDLEGDVDLGASLSKLPRVLA